MRHRISRVLLIVIATVALSVLVNRALNLRDPSPDKKPEANANVPLVRLRPSKLFTGDFERLRPHLRLAASGFFRAEITGPDIMLGYELEIWKDGKKQSNGGSGFSRTREASDVSISLQETAGGDGRKRYSLVCVVAGSTHRTEFEYPELSGNTMSGEVELKEPVVLPENESVPIWAYVVHNDMRRPVSSPVEEAVKHSRWAVLMKARWNRPGE